MMPLRDAALAFRFLTRIPVPGGELRSSDLGRALAWFPVPGLLLGLVAAAVAQLFRGHVSVPLSAVLLVALGGWLTAGLHLDGLADVADGLGGGGGDREKTLAIMRDSRIGALGATTLILVLAAKIGATAELVAPGREAVWALATAPVVARFAAVPLVVLFPYARPQGLGKAFHEGGGAREVATAAVATAVVLAAAGPRALAPAAAVAFSAVAVVPVVLLVWIARRARRVRALSPPDFQVAALAAELAAAAGPVARPRSGP